MVYISFFLSQFSLNEFLDGKWVVDDYYEDKVLEEITARGLKAGDLVGELPDPNAAHHSNELSALNATAAAASNKIERGGGGGGGGGGVYRAGGPTTLFGGIGWGPYSDGPLNAVRKSILSRDGVGEENWMYMMAMRVSDASAEWSELRKEAVKVVQGVDGLVMGGALMPPLTDPKPAVEEIEEPKNDKEEDNEKGVQGQASKKAINDSGEVVDGEKKPLAKKRKKVESSAVGVYDPHSHTIHCEVNHKFPQSYNLSLFRRSVRYTTYICSMGSCPRFYYETTCARWYEIW